MTEYEQVIQKLRSGSNTGVKKAFAKEHVNQADYETIIKIMDRSRRDIVWWAENFFLIRTLDNGKVPIKLYPKQAEFLKFITDNTRIITLAARQTGKCVYKDTKIKIRNKKTGKIEEISILDLYNLFKSK